MSLKKFILNSTELGRVTLADDPEGHGAVKKTYNRNLEYMGIFRKQTLNLKFVGDGLNYCIDLFNISGTEAKLFVTIMVKKDYEDAWELDFQGIGKFNPFDLDWGDDLSPTLSIEFEDSGFHNKFLTRDDTEVNIGNTTSIEGVTLGDMPTRQIQIKQRQIKENNTLQLSANTSYYGWAPLALPDPYILSQKGHVVPAEKISGDTDFIETPIDYLIYPPENLSGLIGRFVTQPVALTLNYHITGSGTTREILGQAAEFVQWKLRKFNDPINLADYTEELLHEVTGLADDADSPFSFDFSGTINVTLNVDQAFTIVCELPDTVGAEDDPAYEIAYTLCDISISLIQNFDEFITNCHYRYEFLQRLLQITTDQVDCIESSVFGRIDLGYPANGKYYNNIATNGFQIRGFTDKYPVWSFKKAMKSMRSIFNVHCGIQRFGSVFKVVIEELPYFFSGEVGITLHNVTKVKRTIAEEFTYSEVRVGYEKAAGYEEVNGLEEYNTKSVHMTFIKSDKNILDLLSPERGDSYGGEFARRNNINISASEDTQYDNDVFIYIVHEVDGLLYPKQDEDYASITNIDSPETALNLDITPQRNLLRNGDWISGCVYKYQSEFLKFVSDPTTDLVSQKTGEELVSEQTSVQNSDLLSSLWLNFFYHFEAPITPAQILEIEKNPYKLIKFSPFNRAQSRKYFYGWVFTINVGGDERKGTFTLLAANINSDRLVLVDPEGISEEEPTTELPPSEDDAGFEYAFEHVFES